MAILAGIFTDFRILKSRVGKMESKIKGGGPDGTESLMVPNFPIRHLKNFSATIQSGARKQKRKSKAFI